MAEEHQTFNVPEKLSGNEVSNILCKNPELANRYPLEKLSGSDWSSLLCVQPQLLPFCDQSKLIIRDWIYIVQSQPLLATHCPWDSFTGDAWAHALCTDYSLHPYCDWSKLNGDHWVKVLSKYTKLAKFCSFDKLNGSNWVTLIFAKPKFVEPCDWNKLEGADWVKLLSKHSQYADHCDWNKFSSHDFAELLCIHPEFANHCDWTKFASYDWEKLLPEQIQFLRHYDGRHFPRDNRSGLVELFLQQEWRSVFSYRTCLRLWNYLPLPEIFQTGEVTPERFQIAYHISRQDAVVYFKKQLTEENWDFIRRLFNVASPLEIRLLPDNDMLFFCLLLAPWDIAFRTVQILLKHKPDLIRNAIDHLGCSAMYYFFLRQAWHNPLLLLEPDEESQQLYNLLIQNGADPSTPMGERRYSYQTYVKSIESYIKNRKFIQNGKAKKHGGK